MKVQLSSFFQPGVEVIKILEQNGYEAFFVGGCVRDMLLQRTVHDLDVCTSAKPDEVQRLFPKVIPTGIQHGTVTVLWREQQVEVTTYRTETKYLNYRHPAHVQFVGSLGEDIKRRDFTINALVMDHEGYVRDYTTGVADLKQKLIRTVGLARERFKEDALRMLRAIRFSAQLGFTIESQTFRAIKEYKHLMEHVASERISVELQKIMGSAYLVFGIDALLQTGMGDSLFPTLPIQHAFRQLLKVPCEQLTEKERWLILLLFIRNEEQALKFLKQLTFPKWQGRELKKLIHLGYEYQSSYRAVHFSDVDLVSLGLDTVYLLLKINLILHLREGSGKDPSLLAEKTRTRELELENSKSQERKNRLTEDLIQKNLQNEREAVKRRFANLALQRVKDLALTGKDLLQIYPQRTPGPWINKTLDALLLAVLHREVENKTESLIDYVIRKERTDETGERS